MPRSNKKRQISPSSSPKRGKKKSAKYNIPLNAVIDPTGNILPPTPHVHKPRSRDASVASQHSLMSSSTRASSNHFKPPQTGSNNNNIQKTSSAKTKPVFVSAGIVVIRNSLVNVTFSATPLYKMVNPTQTQVICATPEDKTKLIEKLKNLKFQFFTFSEPQQKPMLYVLKGHHRVTCDELKTELDEANVPASKVTFLWDNPDRPMYIIHFERGKTNIKVLSSTAKAVGNVIVKWDRFDPAQKRLTQCRNCQLFGHSATNCGNKYRCVKCTDEHEPGKCTRQSKVAEGSPKCVNCQGDHTANSRICQHYSNYEQRVNRQRGNRRAAANDAINSSRIVSNRSTAAPWASPIAAAQIDSRVDFPSLIPPQLRKNHVSKNLNQSSNPAEVLESIHKRFQSIPGIMQSLKIFNDFVARLEAAENENQRQLILLSHCQSNNGN